MTECLITIAVVAGVIISVFTPIVVQLMRRVSDLETQIREENHSYHDCMVRLEETTGKLAMLEIWREKHEKEYEH